MRTFKATSMQVRQGCVKPLCGKDSQPRVVRVPSQSWRHCTVKASLHGPNTASQYKRGSPNWGQPVLISGAGIAGLAMALALTKVGIPVRVFEAGPGLRQEGAAISLWSNAWRALDALGVGDTLRPEFVQHTRVELCSDSGELLRAFRLSECHVGPGGAETRGVRRARLLEALYDSIPDRDTVVTFDTAVDAVLLDGCDGSSSSSRVTDGVSGSGRDGPVAVRLNDGRTVYGSMLVGADGVRSAVARHLELPPAKYSGYLAYRGVAEWPTPTSTPGVSASSPDTGAAAAACRPPLDLPLDTIRLLWGAGVRAGMYPLSPTSVYWFTCFNADEAGASGPPSTPEARQRAALDTVRGWGWRVEEAIRATPPEDITWSRIVDRWTPGTSGRGLVTLAGDAAHPMTPNLGQGGAAALEDAVVLGRKLGRLVAAAAGSGASAGGSHGPAPGALAACLRSYESERSARCLPLTVRSHVMGAALQAPWPPVCLARNLFVRTVFQPSHFLDHTAFDCGTLTGEGL